MKRLAIIPTVFALVAMVAACADMTAPKLSDRPLLRHPEFLTNFTVNCVSIETGQIIGSVGKLQLPDEVANLPTFTAACLALGGRINFFGGIIDVTDD